MYVKIFEGQTANEVETKANDYIKNELPEDFDLWNIVQSESTAVVDGKPSRTVTLTLVFIQELFGLDDEDED